MMNGQNKLTFWTCASSLRVALGLESRLRDRRDKDRVNDVYMKAREWGYKNFLCAFCNSLVFVLMEFPTSLEQQAVQ